MTAIDGLFIVAAVSSAIGIGCVVMDATFPALYCAALSVLIVTAVPW